MPQEVFLTDPDTFYLLSNTSKGAFTTNVKSVLSENLGGILVGSQCEMGDCLILSEIVNIKASW